MLNLTIFRTTTPPNHRVLLCIVFSCVTDICSQPQVISPLCQEFRRAGGPRIKHVCRAASVVLGQPRALVPDDIPRLSALPLHERSGISPSDVAKGQCTLEM